jgi:hypothetical protein
VYVGETGSKRDGYQLRFLIRLSLGLDFSEPWLGTWVLGNPYWKSNEQPEYQPARSPHYKCLSVPQSSKELKALFQTIVWAIQIKVRGAQGTFIHLLISRLALNL